MSDDIDKGQDKINVDSEIENGTEANAVTNPTNNNEIINMVGVDQESIKAYSKIKDNNVFGFKNKNKQEIWVNMALSSTDDNEEEGTPFEYKPETRNYFVRMVFLLVLMMMLATSAIVSIIYFVPIISILFMGPFGKGIMAFSSMVLLAMSLAMSCFAFTRRFPCNILCLVVVVIFMSLLLGAVMVRFDIKEILIAFITTCIVVFACFLLAFTKFDFTKFLLYVIVISLAVTILSLSCFIFSKIFGPMPILRTAIVIVSTLVNIVFLIIELQMILGGKSVEIDEDDYAIAAYMVYNSIIQLFINILQLVRMFSD